MSTDKHGQLRLVLFVFGQLQFFATSRLLRDFA